MFESYSCDKLQALLDDALNSLHRLRTGQSPRVIVDQNGERVEFTAANQQGLITYINQLQATMARKGCGNGSCPAPSMVSRPLTFSF